MRLLQQPPGETASLPSAVGPGLLGIGTVAPPRKGFETDAPLCPPTPDTLGTARNVPKSYAGFPRSRASAAFPDGIRAPQRSVGDHVPTGRGAKVPALAELLPPRCGQEDREVAGAGRRPAVVAAETPRAPSRRRHPPAQLQAGAAGVESGSLAGPGSEPLGPLRREPGGGIRKEAFKSSQASGSGNKGGEGRSQFRGCPLGRRNAKGR